MNPTFVLRQSAESERFSISHASNPGASNPVQDAVTMCVIARADICARSIACKHACVLICRAALAHSCMRCAVVGPYPSGSAWKRPACPLPAPKRTNDHQFHCALRVEESRRDQAILARPMMPSRSTERGSNAAEDWRIRWNEYMRASWCEFCKNARWSRSIDVRTKRTCNSISERRKKVSSTNSSSEQSRVAKKMSGHQASHA